MACIENCVVSDTIFLFSTDQYGVFTFTEFVGEGEAISFQRVETNVDGKYTPSGALFLAGHDYSKLGFTITVPCNEVGLALFNVFIRLPARMCGVGGIDTNCCSDLVFKSLWLKGAVPPNVSDSVEYYAFEFEGVLV